MADSVLVRYGAMGEVGRFTAPAVVPAGSDVVVRSVRGEEAGTVVGPALRGEEAGDSALPILRTATPEDRLAAARRSAACQVEFPRWQERIRDWQVDLELIDLERTLDDKLILYVLNDRGPETTKLALRAAAAGLGVIEVQPVGPEGLIPVAQGGGCGNCGRK